MAKLLPKTIRIINYRSIKDLTLSFKKDLCILVGKNECGKTNILSAISSLDPAQKLDPKSVRMGTGVNEQSEIIFVLSVELLEVFNEIKNEIYDASILQALMKYAEHNKTINVELHINVRSNERSLKFELPEDIIDEAEYSIIQSRQGAVSITESSSKERITLNTQNHSIIIDPNKYESSSYIVKADRAKILDILKLLIRTTFKLPNVLYWKYSDEFLLPDIIDVQKFVSSPDTCVPLKNIFEAVGTRNIKDEYNDKIHQDRNAWPNYLEDVTRKINRYIKRIWSTSAKLKIEAFGDNNIRISIKDSRNSYSLSERSDGYKRMLTFITMVSTRSTTSKIHDFIIVIDEPDATVDIPGTKFLLTELIRMSADNFVYISTHSPSMVDVKNVSRHIIVTKNDETTKTLVANESNYINADTLYEGLGMQYYALLGDKNIGFEGWTDKQLFDKYISFADEKEYKNITATFTGGVDNFSNFSSLWMAIAKKPSLILISDNDQKAISNRSNYTKSNKPIRWFTYDELCNKKINTAEDFIDISYLIKVSTNVLLRYDKNLKSKISFSTVKNWNELIKQLRKILNKASSSDKSYDIDRIIFNIKQAIYEELPPEYILSDYDVFIKNAIRQFNQQGSHLSLEKTTTSQKRKN